METEGRLVEYVCGATYADLPPSILEVVKNQVLTVPGYDDRGGRGRLVNAAAGFVNKESDGKEEADHPHPRGEGPGPGRGPPPRGDGEGPRSSGHAAF